MANFSGSFRLPPSLSPLHRPQRLGRAGSMSSDVSESTSVVSEERQFVVSGCNTPALQELGGQMHNSIDVLPPAWPTKPDLDIEVPHATLQVSNSSESSAHACSRPIAIEVSGPRKSHPDPVYTPLEPLSARGDIPGGYFPLHEDLNPRVHRPHPFHLDIKRARNDSLNQAAESAEVAVAVNQLSATVMLSEATPPVIHGSVSSSRTSVNTPVASYIPTGANGSPLPMGKYYPSNYEMRNSGSSGPKKLRPASSAMPALPAKSDSHVPMYSKHIRSDSEAKRRLQQYQRDMVAQATLAASQVLGTNLRLESSTLTSTPSLSSAAMKKVQLKASMAQKPVSPRLIPLGSPGPVTPMELEDGNAGYLTQGRPLSSPDASREIEEISRAFRAEQDRRRREGTGSPAMMGPVST